MSLFGKVKAAAEDIAHDAQSIFVKTFGQAAVDQFETTIKGLWEQDVMTIFTDAITLAETLQVGGAPATSEQKQAAAFTQIEKDLLAAGKSLATNVINLGIELVVGLLHSKTPAAV
jgi:hypothetical protein